MRMFIFLERMLRKAEVSRAVFFGVMARMWSVISGPVIALFIAIKFTPSLQGYYYTFWSLLALQVFVELGLGTVIIQFTSHEWSKLQLDRDGYVTGEKDALSRLVSLAHIMTRWYLCGGVIAAAGLSVGGYFFFSRSADAANTVWLLPWLVLCILTGINICLTPLWSILEGCNQVSNIYTYRFFQGLFNSLAVCSVIWLGGGLWALSVSALVTVICSLLFLGFKYKNFFKSILFTNVSGPRMEWQEEILPMQWRMAISFISGYFTFSLFVPVLFKFHGPVIAGQMGMTWSVIGFMGTIPSAWLIPKVPQFGMLIARKDYRELDRVFYRIMKIFAVITVTLAFSIWFFVYLLNMLKVPIAGRLLSPLSTAIFISAQVITMLFLPMAVYLRAHKKEPLLAVSIMTGVLVGVFTIVLGKLYSVIGMALGYVLAASLVAPVFMVIWHRCRSEWHSDENEGNCCPVCGKKTDTLLSTLRKIKERGIIYSCRRGLYIALCNVAGLILSPLCRLFNIKFLPVYTRAIGHLCGEPDCYIKEAMVGMRPNYRTLVLAPRKEVTNPYVLDYWKKYLTFIESPLLCGLLSPLANNKFTRYDLFNYFFGLSSRIPEIQRRYGNRPPLLSLTEADRRRGWECLKALGVPQDAWFVCVHCREDGYLGNVNQSTRNVNIANYRLAMDEIVKRGGWVIRLGDASMKPIPAGNRIIDYVHLPIKSGWMDLFLCASCRFFLGSSSGLNVLPAIFGVPSGVANLIPLSVALPFGPQDVGIPKLSWSRKEKRYLTFEETFDSPVGRCCHDPLYAQEEVEAVENSPEDILGLAIEMLEKTEGKLVYSEEDERLQARFKSLLEPAHWSYGSTSRIGRDFLRKHSYLFGEKYEIYSTAS